jgi:uncharacterized protein YgbK (DUF1537 family)
MATKKRKKAQRLLVGFYGDDFTGSTDALESLSRAGIRTVLFTSPPSAAQLAEYPRLQAVGVAGMTRSMAVPEMRYELRPALTALRALKPRMVHYKVCSTFDSSPRIGSVGAVMDLAWELFKPRFIPLVVGAPALGRYCVFGNLFARAGRDPEPVRLDRHPTMSRHPVTPADESDLRLYLARQTRKRVALFDVLKLTRPGPERSAALSRVLKDKPDIVLFDVLSEEQLRAIGELLDACAEGERPLFSVGSSGLGTALARHWETAGRIRPVKNWPSPGRAAPLLVVSGSCSPVTAEQIRWAARKGFAEVVMDTPRLMNAKDGALVEAETSRRIVKHLQQGRSVVVHSSCGPDDPRLMAVQKTRRGQSLVSSSPAMDGAALGSALGRITRETLQHVKLRRVCLAGGDTSSYVARTLGVESMEMIAPLAPGAPLCRVRAPGSTADGLEMNFKGGQVGGPDYFGRVQDGRKE